MIYGFLSLITTTSICAFGIIGTITVINKAGHFLKNMEEEKKDGYKKAFDKFMIETIDEINFSLDSVKLISKHTLKNSKASENLNSNNENLNTSEILASTEKLNVNVNGSGNINENNTKKSKDPNGSNIGY